jgi:hypothetical protein
MPLGKNLLLGPKPPNWSQFVENVFDHVYYVGEALRFDWTVTGTAPDSYEVRNYDGVVVASGSLVSNFVTLPALPCGWFKFQLIASGVTTNMADQTDLDTVTVMGQVNYASSVGDCYFCVVPVDSRFPTRPAPGTAETAFGDYDLIFRGMTAMGPNRYSIGDTTDVMNAGVHDAVPNIKNCVTIENSWYKNPSFADANRPRPLFVSFETATANPPGSATQATYDAGVRQVVNELYPVGVEWFEGPHNEPNVATYYPEQTASETVTLMQKFYNNVKAANPSAKVLGVNPVNYSGLGLGYFDEFLRLGGGQYCDGFSFHAYNSGIGDVSLARRCLSVLQGILTNRGQTGKPLWQTEFQPKAVEAGLFDPHVHMQWTAVQMLMQEGYGLPKEHNHYWYDVSHGFWSWATFWKALDKKSLMPGAVMFRTMSAELYGKTHTSRYDFGADHNDQYVGSLFTNPTTGDKVAWLMTGGSLDGQVKLGLSGATSVVTVDLWGNETTVNASAGVVAVPVRELPTYVRLPSGVTATLLDFGFGLDRALSTNGATISSSLVLDAPSTAKLNKVIARDDPNSAQLHRNSYWANTEDPANEFFPFNTTTLPASFDVTFNGSHNVNRVVVFASPVWQAQSTLLDFDVATKNGDGTWTVRSTVVNTDAVVIERLANQDTSASFVDVYKSRRWIFNVTFADVTTTAIRLTVRDTTLGQYPNQTVQDRHPQVWPKRIVLRQIQAFGGGDTPDTARRVAALI